jgi:hypothetical protein
LFLFLFFLCLVTVYNKSNNHLSLHTGKHKNQRHMQVEI